MKEITSGIQICYQKIFSTCPVNSVCKIGYKIVNFEFFFQKVPDEILFNDWFLIPAREDCTKLKRNLQWSKNCPGGSQDP